MERIVSFEVEPEHFVLSELFEDYPDVRMRFGRAVPTETAPMEYLWVANVSPGEFGDAARSSPATSDVEILGDTGDWTQSRIRWRPAERLPALFEGVVEADAAVRSIRTVGGQWHFSLQFRSNDSVSAFRDRCLGNGVPLRITELREAPATGTTLLTERQREIVDLALDRGYYDVPRQTTLEELADELDAGLAAVSEGLRRAEERIVRSYFYPQSRLQRPSHSSKT